MDGGFYQDVFYFILTYLNVWSDLRSVEDLKIVRLSQAMSKKGGAKHAYSKSMRIIL